MKKPLNYYGYAFQDPAEGYNEHYLKTKKGKKDIKKEKKSNKRLKKQIKERGFDDSECWNLDNTIAHFVYPRLKRLRKIVHGYPHELTPELWDEHLKKMAKSFKMIIDDDFTDENLKEFQEGMDLFAKYFRNLWD